VNNHAHTLKFDNIASQKLIEYYLNSIKLDDYVSGMAQPKLNQKKLNSIPVPYPSLETQGKTVTQLDELKSQTQSLESNYQQELNALDELKISILQKAFNGEL
jgi:type I restriction enzyme S subunit